MSGMAAEESSSKFKPYVPDGATMQELTFSSVLLGSVLGIVFGASSLYLVLRVGMTVSASIPVAVLAITVFRALSKAFKTRGATILENNIVQTTGSAGESIAFGVGVTMPALLILGYDMDLARVMLVAGLGGLLGILMMIPLRRAFIVKQHGQLAYPEGTACAKVLIAGEQGGSSAKTVFTGFGLAFGFQVLMQALKLWEEYPRKAFESYKGAVLSLESSPVLLGVGYIIGPRIAAVTVAGGLLAAMVLVPAITLFGAQATEPIFASKPISQMTPTDIHKAYVLYIGAGAVATGGIISLIQALPLILGSIKSGLSDIGSKGSKTDGRRTERDLPLWLVVLGSLGLVAAIASTHLIPTDMTGRLVGSLLILVFGFLFVTVSSRLTGEIGSSSNPISGMTVATLLLTCLVFVLAGWVGPEFRLAALSIAGVVCIASSNGGTTSQDLKTGYLVGATPSKQQISILVGALSSAVVIGFTLLLLNDASTVYTTKAEFLPTVAAPAELSETADHEGKTYKVWRVVEPIAGAQPGKYLVDDSGKAVILVDPAINGRVDTKDDGTKVTKYDAPKATLMALIIDGIMTQRLPWGLVLIGAMIAVVMHLAGVPALAFAVGVYLPLSTSMPIFVGGAVRWFCERSRKLSPEEADSSPAVLLSSGYIAGGAIAGILIAAVAVIPGAAKLLDLSAMLPEWWKESPLPSLVAFGGMTLVLLLTGTGTLFKDAAAPASESKTAA
ncbi:MAG: oligopeptide transporter, OPT family [Isosphaeraceae bacterium]|nr:oligopeptide transporter, OPT family [Isosphaeraceae bacterium]